MNTLNLFMILPNGTNSLQLGWHGHFSYIFERVIDKLFQKVILFSAKVIQARLMFNELFF